VAIFCPQCGSQRISTDVRFCSRCGFNLETVEQLVVTGHLPQLAVVGSTEISPRKKGLRLGAKFLFASIVTFPVIFALCVAFNSPGPLVISFLLFLLGVSHMSYARLFLEDVPRPSGQLPVMSGPPPVGALPVYRAPVSFTSPRGATTGELRTPPSVTEHTTNLLDRPAEGGRATDS
jgi:hypothetical protein